MTRADARRPGPSPTHVLLVEDHRVFREALALAVALEPDLGIAGQAGSVAEARALIQGGARFDVLVLDLDLPDGHGASLIERMLATRPGTQVLVLTASADRSDLTGAVRAGAAGVLHKTSELVDIIGAIRLLGAGQSLLTPEEVASLAREDRVEHRRERIEREALAQLTRREREVLQLLAEGLADREIAARLSISPPTVHAHMARLLGKLGVESRLKALIVAVRHGVVTLER